MRKEDGPKIKQKRIESVGAKCNTRFSPSNYKIQKGKPTRRFFCSLLKKEIILLSIELSIELQYIRDWETISRYLRKK